MGKMDDKNLASSSKTPGTVLRKRQTNDPRSASKKTMAVYIEQLQLQRKMALNVARIVHSVEAVVYGTLSSQREYLQGKISNLEMRKVECTNERAVTLINDRISQLQCSIVQIEDDIDVRAVGPKMIDFTIREPTPSAT